jgi:hypothetical protein
MAKVKRLSSTPTGGQIGKAESLLLMERLISGLDPDETDPQSKFFDVPLLEQNS